jgi:putative membrane protein
MAARTTLPMTRTAAAATDLVVGVAAGLGAACAMNLFQSACAWLTRSAEPDETAASRAADALSKQVSGKPVKRSKKKYADTVMHYLTGAALGGFYGLVGGLFPAMMAGRGALFGAGAWIFGDEVVVPALRLGLAPAKMKALDHGLALASHLVFGVALDSSRRKLNQAISAQP